MNYKYDIFIKNGNTIIDEKKEKLNIGILDGKIQLITTSSNHKAKQVIDAKNLIILPGIIDSQVHFREPGSIHKENMESGTKGAILGGVTSIFEMPNTYPPTATKRLLNQKFKLAKNRMWSNYAFFAGATGNNIDKLSSLEKVPGCCGIKIFMGSSTGNLLVALEEDIDKVLRVINNNI